MRYRRLALMFLLATALSAGLAFAHETDAIAIDATVPGLWCCDNWLFWLLGICLPPGLGC